MRDRTFWEPAQGTSIGRARYDVVQNELSFRPSNVTLVQSATATIAGNPQTVQLLGVVAGNRLVIAFGARTPTFLLVNIPALSDSQSQAISLITHDEIAGISSSGCYAAVGTIPSALAGTHTISIQTADISQGGQITLYEIAGSVATSAVHLSSAMITTINVPPGIVQTAGQLAIGGCGSSITGGIGASFVWSGIVQSLNQDGSDANFNGLCGHYLGPISRNDFGAARQGVLTPNGMALAGVVFG